ncbi:MULTISPECIES: transglutaminase family protein [Shewanella]|uniref:Tetratricopeptide repeat protein n=2 Tax=Shewanella TaxID=22 RepID=A0A974XIU8_9GAMM|nr:MULTISPECIES: tetratricopeptide repeat protein [Shewanella]QSX29164.1 tetratricopeptide repeat protein [Shewanella cyperi]QSX36307.1 tetratricopeptide repeat protein [Shewanella sedimentimangrovi]QSX39909.1 tetratricopeptide repeat protein [Shewanella cyperi]
MSDFCLDSGISLPETPLAVIEHLGLGDKAQAQWAWYELSGAVLSHYLVDQTQRFKALLNWFYRDLGFSCHSDYFGLDAANFSLCLHRRQGNSTCLAVILMLLGKQLDLKLDALLLPGMTVLVWRQGKQPLYLDPLTGELLSRQRLHAIVRGELGNSAPFKPTYLKGATVKQLLSRMLHELKAGAIVAHKFEAALECCNLLMQWYPEDASLNRERAFIAQQLGAIQVAVSDLRHFIDMSPHDPVVELVKLQLRELKEQQQILH